jgi:GH24 family phage-related lysozyme (muramidase)
MKISTKGLALIKDMEGCELTAYFCPAGVLSIGFGSTGPHVKPGMTITEAEAEALLLNDLVRFEKAVNELVKVPMTQGAYDAMVSFTFNCGEGAFAESTLLKELNEGKDPNAVAKAQLPRWTNGGLAGLVRRRAAEVELFCSGGGLAPIAATKPDLKCVVATLLKKRPVPGDQLADKEKHLVEIGRAYNDCVVLKDEAGHKLIGLPFGQGEWYCYPPHWEGLATGPKAKPPSATGAVDLKVPFWPQTDNFTQSERTCNTSSCAMALEFFKPEAVINDNQYLKKLIDGGYGDTTSHQAQGNLLASYGLKSTWHTNLSLADLEKEIRAGRPVVCGILHRGSESAPTGGHMILVRGLTSSGDFRVNDPYGSCNDGYSGPVENGNNAIYSHKMMAARWTPDGPNSGWGRTFQP